MDFQTMSVRMPQGSQEQCTYLVPHQGGRVSVSGICGPQVIPLGPLDGEPLCRTRHLVSRFDARRSCFKFYGLEVREVWRASLVLQVTAFSHSLSPMCWVFSCPLSGEEMSVKD